MIEIVSLTKKYQDKSAIEEFTLTVRPGDILGLLGHNGAGKSTTLKAAVGLLRPTSGRVSIAGYDIETEPVQAKSCFGYVPESPLFYESLTPEIFLDVIGDLHHLDRAKIVSRRRELFSVLEIGNDSSKRFRELSKGTRQKVTICAALMHEPPVLILDEPFDGLDYRSRSTVETILRYASSAKQTVLISSHLVEVVENLCNRFCILHRGRKAIEGDLKQVLQGTKTTALGAALNEASSLHMS